MNLTKNVILKEIYNKNIVITHFKKENLGPASYDITLANQIRVFKNSSENTPYPIDNNAN